MELQDRDAAGAQRRTLRCVLQSIDLDDASNPDNFQLRVDGSALQTSISVKQDALGPSSSLSLGSLGLGGGSASEHDNGSFRVLNVQHDIGLNFAVAASSPPAWLEAYYQMSISFFVERYASDIQD